MDMAGENTNIEKGSENHYHGHNVSSDWVVNGNNITNTSIGVVDNSFCPPIWDQPINGQNFGYCDVNVQNDVSLKGNMFPPAVNTVAPHSLPHFPADSGFIERAARFSCFGSGNLVEMMNPFSVADNLSPYSRSLGMMVQGQNDVFGGNASKSMQLQRNEVNMYEGSKQAFKNDHKKSESLAGNESDEAEFSGRGGAQEELDGVAGESSSKGFVPKKRKRGEQGNERNEKDEAPQASIETGKDNAEIKQKGDKKSPMSSGKPGGKNSKQGSQGSDPPKEDYIHIRARRGQATNSHSLAERVRREKISERMKFLQDLVPGCSKVTGKAVMLDEIINYVQSLQRQVEFLSMKLATVNPRLDFNIEGFLAKDILQHRPGMSSSLAFPSDMTMHFPQLHHPSPAGLIQACLASNSSETLRRPINLQSIANAGGFKEPTSQVPTAWEDELHNILHMGVNSSAPPTNQDLSGSLPLGHMKPEP